MIKSVLQRGVVLGFGILLAATPASAQRPGPEFGIQLAQFRMLNPDGPGNNVTDFGFGAGNVSVAWYANEMIALEPTLVFDHSKPEGGDAGTQIDFQLAVPIYLSKGWGKGGGLFIAPHAGVVHFSGTGPSSSQTHFGANIGTKLKITDALFWRVQGGIDMGAKHDIFAKYSRLAASFGLSVYLP